MDGQAYEIPDVADLYDRIAPTYDQVRQWDRRVSARMLELAGIGPGDTVRPILEVGCGTGNVTVNLEALTQAPIIGLDLSAGMLRRAVEKLKRSRLVRANGQRMPFPAASFHLVLAAMVIHHVTDRAALLSECARVLAPGGTLIIVTTGHAQIARHFLTRFFPSFARIDQSRFPDIPVITREMQGAGVVAVESRAIAVAENTPATYLEKVRQKHLSTFHLLSAQEYTRGLQALADYVRREPNAPPVTHAGTLIWGRLPARELPGPEFR